jgi:hypothetical protein
MKLRVSGGAAALLILNSFCFAADPPKAPQPGQLASAEMTAPLAASNAMSTSDADAASVSIANVHDPHDRLMHRLWIASMVAAVAGTTLDAATSWGKLESNSLLASSNGTFGGRGIAIKAGLGAGVIIPQICLRKHKEYRAAFIIGNLGEASIFSAATAHNLSIRSAQ